MKINRNHILQLVTEGEHVHQDFKFAITDACKIARSLSAFSNTEGGRLLVGVKDNGKIAGIRSAEEIYMIEVAATQYCRPSVTLDSQIYKVDGKDVLEVSVAESQHKPVYAIDEDNLRHIFALRTKLYLQVRCISIFGGMTVATLLLRATRKSSASCAFWRSMASLRLTGVSDCRIFPAVR